MPPEEPAADRSKLSLRKRYRAFLSGERREEHPGLWALFQVVRVVTGAGRKFKRDRCFTHAASLAYATLMALVPMSVLAFTFFSAFNRYADLRERAEERVFDYFVPSVGEQVVTLLDQVTVNIQRLSLPGLLLFLFAATVLLNSLEVSVNAIWGVRKNRAFFTKLVISWSLLTLVPVLMAAGTVVAAENKLGEMMSHQLQLAVTFIGTWAAFFLVIHVMPNTRTRPMASLAGACFGAALWLVMRNFFIWYVSHIPIQTALGTSMATVALFLLWVYFSWCVMLLSAEVAYVIQVPMTPEEEERTATLVERYRAFYSLVVLGAVVRRYRLGRTEEVDGKQLGEELDLPAGLARAVCLDLVREGILLRTENGGLVPGRPPHEERVADVLERLGLTGLEAPDDARGPLGGPIASMFEAASERSLKALREQTVADLALEAEDARTAELRPV